MATHRVRVHPGPLAGTVRVPGDKSLSHRSLILAALADGGCRVQGVAPSGDVLSTAAALRTMGASVDLAAADDGQLRGRVTGHLGEPDDVVDCGNSGTGMRLLAGVAAGIDGVTVLTGDGSLRRRPMGRIAQPLRAMGASVDGRDGGRLPPLVVRGGGLQPIVWTSPVASAQVKSCLLLAGLTAGVDVSVHLPLPSRDHTERMLWSMGVEIRRTTGRGGEHVRLHPGPLQAPEVIQVPGDPSSAAFWLVAGAAAQEGRVTVEGICVNPTRIGVVDVLRDLGAPVEVEDSDIAGSEPVADVSVTGGPLLAAKVAGRRVVDAIDELPVLAVAGAVSQGGLEVVDAAELRAKESDRIAILAEAFRAIGLTIEERPDGYRVPGGQRPGPGTVDSHGDHRIAMTACIAATLGTGPVDVTGFASVATSYPSFLDDLTRLGGQVEILDAD